MTLKPAFSSRVVTARASCQEGKAPPQGAVEVSVHRLWELVRVRWERRPRGSRASQMRWRARGSRRGVVGTAGVDVEEAVGSLRARTDAVESQRPV